MPTFSPTPSQNQEKKEKRRRRKTHKQPNKCCITQTSQLPTYANLFLLSLWWGKEALSILILGGKEKKIFYSLFSFLFIFFFLFLLWQAFANQAKLCNVTFGHHVFISTKDFGGSLVSTPNSFKPFTLPRLNTVKGIQAKFAIHALCMQFWKTLCIKKVDLTHLLSPAIYPQIILYHHDHPYYTYHALPKKIRPKKNVFCSIPFDISKLPLENNF